MRLAYEREGLAAFELPAGIAERYGGTIGWDGPVVVANFVSTLDGVVAIPQVERSNVLINRGSDDDRFVMGLLRALCDAILVGSGTFHAAPHGRWLAEGIHPDSAEDYATLREQLGMAEPPQLVVLAGSSGLDRDHPALRDGALVLAPNEQMAQRLRGELPAQAQVVSCGSGDRVDVTRAIALLRERGHRTILAEAGPRVFGALLAAGLVDELFLTVAAQLAGRAATSPERLALVEGAAFLPHTNCELELLSIRIASRGDLMLRYRTTNGEH